MKPPILRQKEETTLSIVEEPYGFQTHIHRFVQGLCNSSLPIVLGVMQGDGRDPCLL
jgi:hypothetical protein